MSSDDDTLCPLCHEDSLDMRGCLNPACESHTFCEWCGDRPGEMVYDRDRVCRPCLDGEIDAVSAQIDLLTLEIPGDAGVVTWPAGLALGLDELHERREALLASAKE